MRLRILAITALCAITGAVCRAQAPGENVIDNPSLEEALPAGTLPSRWALFTSPGSTYSFSIVEPGRTGSKSLLLEGSGQYAGISTNGIRLDRNLRYFARAYVRVEGTEGAGAQIKISYLDQGGDYIDATLPQGVIKPGGSAWQPVSLMDTAARFPNAAFLQLACVLQGNGRAWFDDLELVSREKDSDLLPDGGFECAVGSRISMWIPTISAGGHVALEASPREPKAGQLCMRVVGTAESAVASSGMIPVEKGKQYTLRGWARATKGTAALRMAYFREEAGGKRVQLGRSTSELVTADVWTERSLRAELEKYPGTTHITAVAISAGPEIDTRFDAFRLSTQ